jgi:hypothetical protein
LATSDKTRWRDSREPGHFWADNEIIIKFGPDLGAYGISVYMVVSMLARNDDGRFRITARQIAKLIGISPAQAARELNKLLTLELAIREYKATTNKEASEYRLISVPKMTAAQVAEFWRLMRQGKDTAKSPSLQETLPVKSVSDRDGSVSGGNGSVSGGNGSVSTRDTYIDLRLNTKTKGEYQFFESWINSLKVKRAQQTELGKQNLQAALLAMPEFSDRDIADAIAAQLGVTGDQNAALLVGALCRHAERFPEIPLEERGRVLLKAWFTYKAAPGDYKAQWRKFFADGMFFDVKVRETGKVKDAAPLVEERRKQLQQFRANQK